MKAFPVSLILGLAITCQAAEPTVREQATAVLAQSDQLPKPLPTAKQLTHADKKDATLATPEPMVQLPDYDVTATRSVIPNKAKIELDLAKNAVAVQQEKAQLKATEMDRGLNREDSSIDFGWGGFAFGYDTAAERAAQARDRLKVLDLEQTIVLTSLATSEKDGKELERLLADLKGPTAPAYMKRQ